MAKLVINFVIKMYY